MSIQPATHVAHISAYESDFAWPCNIPFNWRPYKTVKHAKEVLIHNIRSNTSAKEGLCQVIKIHICACKYKNKTHLYWSVCVGPRVIKFNLNADLLVLLIKPSNKLASINTFVEYTGYPRT